MLRVLLPLPGILLPFCLMAGPCRSPGGTAELSGSGWITLWNGDGTSDWRMAGPGGFVVEDDVLRATGGMGLLWYAKRPFRDFTLRLEWRVDHPGDNSGVFVRFPAPADDPWVAVNQGYEIQICDTAEPGHNTGSIYSFQGPDTVPTRPPGQWNTYEITVLGQEYTVKVNGQLVNRYTGERSREGFIGIQNHDDGSPVRFRNVRVRPLD